MNQIKLFKYVMAFNLMLSPIVTSAYGQADRGGNGGNGLIAQFEFNVEQIQGWLLRSNLNKVDLSMLTPAIDSNKLGSDVVQITKQVLDHSIKLEFVDAELKIGDEARTCKNFKEINLIQCNNKRWTSDETPESRYILTMHELISIAGYENNDGLASEYKISRKILPYVAPSTTYILVDDEQEKTYPGIQCEIEVGSKTKNNRRIIIQAHELGARLLFRENGLQLDYELSKKYENRKSFLAVDSNGRFGNFKLILDDGTVMEIWAGMATSSPEPFFTIDVFPKGSVYYRVYDQGHCTPLNFIDNDLYHTEGHFGTTMLHYETHYSVDDEDRKNHLKNGEKWLKSIAEKVKWEKQ